MTLVEFGKTGEVATRFPRLVSDATLLCCRPVDRPDAAARVAAIATADYPPSALRPANSRLDGGKIARAYGVAASDWRAGLATLSEVPS